MKPKRISFNKKKMSLFLNIDPKGLFLGDRSSLEEWGYLQKSQFNIVVIGAKGAILIKKALSSLSLEKRECVMGKIEDLINCCGWDYSLYHSTLHVVSKSGKNGMRKSMIQIVKVPGVDVFYRRLNKILGIEIFTQFTYITLYTKGDNKKANEGIRINSVDEFEQIKIQ